MQTKKYFGLVMTSGLIVLVLAGCAISYILPYYMGSYRGKVVDIDTGEPLAGAVVIAIYSSSSASPAGMLSKEIDAQETLTDANGEFVLPEVAVNGTKYSGHLDGRLKIFKPGYGAFPTSPKKIIRLCREDDGTWVQGCSMAEKKYMLYKLPKLNTIEERKRNIPSESSFVPQEKQVLLIRAIIEERRSVGLTSMPILPIVKE